MKTNGWRREHSTKGTQLFFFLFMWKALRGMGYPSASQRSDHGVSYKGLMPSEEILILEARGAGQETQYPPAWLLLSFISSHCDKSHFNLLELDVDPERACCQLHEGLGVGSCAEESKALECAEPVGRHRCLCFWKLLEFQSIALQGGGGKLKQCAPASVRFISCPVGHLSN